ncbi:hypothetical protein [Streptomyces sp. E2N166]|uniref:hypothetical protein n=1 Tax=Streptomyces sp. E2N166 TaxID=1851909 RepID=UPI000EF6B21D|nr:hypothetical protein [Streptomyces sp. E2N166]
MALEQLLGVAEEASVRLRRLGTDHIDLRGAGNGLDVRGARIRVLGVPAGPGGEDDVTTVAAGGEALADDRERGEDPANRQP